MTSQSLRAFKSTEPSQSRRACRATACGSYGWLLPTPFWCLSPFALSTSVKPEADALHNVSSAMTSLHSSVEHRRNTHVNLRSPGRTENMVSSWRGEHLITCEAITLRRHDGGSLSSKTSENNTASETTQQAFTPQSNLTNPASLQELPTASVQYMPRVSSLHLFANGIRQARWRPHELHLLFFRFVRRGGLSWRQPRGLLSQIFLEKKNFVVIRLLSFSFHCNCSIHVSFHDHCDMSSAERKTKLCLSALRKNLFQQGPETRVQHVRRPESH